MEKDSKFVNFHAYRRSQNQKKRGVIYASKADNSGKIKRLESTTLERLSDATGISKSALGKYEADDFKDISPFSIATLAKFYGVSTDYLLGLTETKNHPNTDLHDLHLGDDMIDLLKSGKLNNRLLSEMALHKDFQRLMVDIEIFVDRIADMRINDMNTMLESSRQKIMQQYHPGENDLYMRTLELAQITEEDYFSHVVHRIWTAS